LAASTSAARAGKKVSAQVLQQERNALSINAISQLEAKSKEAELSAPDGKEKAEVNALLVCERPPAHSTSGIWVSFRKYVIEYLLPASG